MAPRIPVNPFPPPALTVEQVAIALLKAGHSFEQVQEFLVRVKTR